jgi:hypothetical protein
MSPAGLFCRGAASLAIVNQAAVVAAGPARAAGHLQALVAQQRITIFWGRAGAEIPERGAFGASVRVTDAVPAWNHNAGNHVFVDGPAAPSPNPLVTRGRYRDPGRPEGRGLLGGEAAADPCDNPVLSQARTTPRSHTLSPLRKDQSQN